MFVLTALLSVAYATTVDQDGDGFDDTVDCNDLDASVFPGAPELCDGVDNDCDGVIDDGTNQVQLFDDLDMDRFGNPNAPAGMGCASNANPAGGGFFVASLLGAPRLRTDVSPDNSDCDDTNSAINPAAPEVCDSVDNDCDGMIDEGCPTGGNTGHTGTPTGPTAATGDTGRNALGNPPASPPPTAPGQAESEPSSGCLATGGGLSAILLPFGLLAFRRRDAETNDLG